METTVSEVTTACGYCSTGCNIVVQLENQVVKRVKPNPDYPVNRGKVCPKGFNLLVPMAAPDRGTSPLLRGADGRFEAVTWDRAASEFASRIKDVQARYGRESFAYLSTGQIPVEEMALLGAITKFGMGVVHGDGNTRQCMATAATAYKQAFGFDAPPFTYEDFELSDVLVFVGSNPVIAHPIMWNRVKANTNNPTIIVVDPRRTETASEASLHLQIKPKGDLFLLQAVARLLLEHNWVKESFLAEHTEGWAEYRDYLLGLDLAELEGACGLSYEQVLELTKTIYHGKRVSFWWTMGVNQSHQGVRTAQAIINICLMTGNIGRPGTGPNSITGQANAMGSRILSNTTNLFAGRAFENEKDRKDVARILGIPVECIPDKPSLPYDGIIDAIREGKIKALWIIATNPAHTWIHKNDFLETISGLEFLVVQDLYPSAETATHADLYLPAAGNGEKTGIIINSERRISLMQPVLQPPADAKTDFEIFKLLAKAYGCWHLFEKWKTPEAVFQILKDLTRGRPCDFSGIRDHQMIVELGGIQWPFGEKEAVEFAAQRALTEVDAELEAALAAAQAATAENVAGAATPAPGAAATTTGTPAPTFAPSTPASAPATDKQAIPIPMQQRRLFEDLKFFTESGRARMLFEAPAPAAELPDAEYPVFLLTGRGSVYQFHTQTRTGRVPILAKNYPATIYVEIGPGDAKELGVVDGDPVRVTSRRGTLVATAQVQDKVQPGHVFIPMHYSEVNLLTYPSFDTYSRQPSFKVSAVRLEKAG